MLLQRRREHGTRPSGELHASAGEVHETSGEAHEQQIESGQYASLEDLAKGLKLDRGYVGPMLRLTSLAPDIVEAVVRGKEPEGISLPLPPGTEFTYRDLSIQALKRVAPVQSVYTGWTVLTTRAAVYCLDRSGRVPVRLGGSKEGL